MTTQFLARFQLSAAEQAALTARNLSPAFFDALARVHAIHK
jgi:hypothetical protein